MITNVYTRYILRCISKVAAKRAWKSMEIWIWWDRNIFEILSLQQRTKLGITVTGNFVVLIYDRTCPYDTSVEQCYKAAYGPVAHYLECMIIGLIHRIMWLINWSARGNKSNLDIITKGLSSKQSVGKLQTQRYLC